MFSLLSTCIGAIMDTLLFIALFTILIIIIVARFVSYLSEKHRTKQYLGDDAINLKCTPYAKGLASTSPKVE